MHSGQIYNVKIIHDQSFILLTIDALEVPENALEMLETDAVGVLPGDEQLEGVLRGLALVQEEPPELLFLDAGEGVVDDRQH